MDAIRIDRVSKSFGKDVVALDEVSLSVPEGDLFFLLGASGCGKTTLLRMIAGLEKPDSGKIHFGERNVTNVPTHKREAAMMRAQAGLRPSRSVSVRFGIEPSAHAMLS